MYCYSKEEHFKLMTRKDLIKDKEVREEILELGMPRYVCFEPNFARNSKINKDIRSSELEWLICLQKHHNLTNTCLFHAFNLFNELLRKKPMENDSSLREMTTVCAIIANKMTDDKKMKF